MTKGTKIFRTVVCVLLAILLLWGAFLGLVLAAMASQLVFTKGYDVSVAGVDVTKSNRDDVLGDGTVSYSPSSNTLILDNAVIEYDDIVISSDEDLQIHLIGENQFICKDASYIPAVYVADYYHYKDLSIEGDGSLTIEFQNVTGDAQGILASSVMLLADVTVKLPDCTGTSGGIVCDSSLLMASGASLTIENGAANFNSAVRIRGNALLEGGTVLNVLVNGSSAGTCRGISINGDLVLGEGAQVNVSVNDAEASVSECLRVTGLIDLAPDATVTASAVKGHSIECFGSIKAMEGATISASTEGELADAICYGALVNYGAAIHGEVEALGGIYNKTAN
jgi:hypothetical protein